MARYKILQLNKMTCGSRRGLIDMIVQIQPIAPETCLLAGTDIFGQQYAGIATESNTDYEFARTQPLYCYEPKDNKTPIEQEQSTTNVILTEEQPEILLSTYNNKLSATEDLSGSSAIQLTLAKQLSTIIDEDQIDEFNSQISSIRVIYEFELDANANKKACLENQHTQMLPLNDLLDLCVKSMFKKSMVNYAIPGNLLLKDQAMTHSKNVDQYFVFEENPVDFCQFKNDAIALSQPTTKQPYRLQSNLYEQIKDNAMNEAHSFQLKQDDIETVLYKKPNELDPQAITYADFLGEDKKIVAEDTIIEMLTPKRTIKGIKYNYIVGIEQNANASTQFDNPTIYDNGDIFGFFMVGKNMYDAQYSMKMDTASHMSNCRTYVGVQDANNGLVLKYYDNVDYDIQDYATGKSIASQSSSNTLYPYQKVEMFKPTNFGFATRHKSNVFSLKVSNTGLDDESIANYDNEQAEIAKKIKKDIANSIRALAKSIVPANTQLFDTYFVSPE